MYLFIGIYVFIYFLLIKLNISAMDDSILNVIGYETENGTIFAVTKDRLNYARSTDIGRTW